MIAIPPMLMGTSAMLMGTFAMNVHMPTLQPVCEKLLDREDFERIARFETYILFLVWILIFIMMYFIAKFVIFTIKKVYAFLHK